MTIRVLMIDPEEITRWGFHCLCTNKVGEGIVAWKDAENFQEALILLAEARDAVPHAIVTDLNVGGLEFIKQIKEIYQGEVKVVVHTRLPEKLWAHRALRAGAYGFVDRLAGVSALADTIRRVVIDRKIAYPESFRERMMCTMMDNEEAMIDPVGTLSDRELEVFVKIGEGVGTREIAEALTLSPKTVETYRENIKAKLNLRNGTELTQHAVQYILEGGQEGRT